MASLEERKKAFLKAKQEAGDAYALSAKQKNKPYQLYFDHEGTIVCFSNSEQIKTESDWLTYDFTQEQLEVLKGKDLTKYHVRKDPNVDKLYHIELKPLETVYVSSDKDFMYQVEQGSSDDYELLCQILKDELVFVLHDNVKKKYADVYPISATVNGSRLLKFYITRKNDPHFLYHYQVVSLANLLTEKELRFSLDHDFREYSLYTAKLFDKYVRTE